jgi:GntR family transcriptional regulator
LYARAISDIELTLWAEGQCQGVGELGVNCRPPRRSYTELAVASDSRDRSRWGNGSHSVVAGVGHVDGAVWRDSHAAGSVQFCLRGWDAIRRVPSLTRTRDNTEGAVGGPFEYLIGALVGDEEISIGRNSERLGAIQRRRGRAQRRRNGRSSASMRCPGDWRSGAEAQPEPCPDTDESDEDDDRDPPLPPPLPPPGLTNDDLCLLGEGQKHVVSCVQPRHDGDTLLVTMFFVKLDRDNALHLHEQVAAEIRRDIANGEIRPGERLPPAKDMAAVLEVHPNTVLRALRLLRDEGVLEFRRGRGITVAGKPERGIVSAQAQELVALARRFGFGREELISLIQDLP